jgi:hypothetical protein
MKAKNQRFWITLIFVLLIWFVDIKLKIFSTFELSAVIFLMFIFAKLFDIEEK